MASVVQSVERWFRDPGSRVQFPAGGLGVTFFETAPSWVSKMYIFLTTSVNAKYYLNIIFKTWHLNPN